MAVGQSNYPSALDTLVELIGASEWPRAVALTRDITDTATILPVDSTLGYAAPPNMVSIEGERIIYQGMTLDSFTNCLRGQFVADGGLTPRNQLAGSYVRQAHTSTHHRVLADAIMALQVAAPRPGFLQPFAGDVAAIPPGWLNCDWAAYPRVGTYAALYAAIGTAWGAGDGVTTFNVPHLVGRVFVSKNAAQAGMTAVGDLGGAATHILIPAEVALRSHTHGAGSYATDFEPAHSHTQQGGGNVGRAAGASDTAASTTPNTGLEGGHAHDITGSSGAILETANGAAHNNLQPYGTGLWLIKY